MHRTGDIVYYFPTQFELDTDDRSFVKVRISQSMVPKGEGLVIARVINIYFGDTTRFWRKESIGCEAVSESFVKESDIQKELVIKTIFEYAKRYIGVL